MDQGVAVVGASMPADRLPHHREWLLAEQRDLELQDAVGPEVLDGDWRPLVRRVREQLEGYTGRLGIHGPFDGLALMSRDPRVRTLATDRLRQALELGAELGASHMVVHSPFTFFGTPFLPHTPAFDQEAQIALAHATIEPVLPLARDAGCTLVIETIFDKHPGPLLALVGSFGDAARLSIDTGHVYIGHRFGGPPPDAWIREAGSLLAHLHLQDTDGNLDRHWAPGDGAVNWFALFEALAALPQRPRLLLELKDCDQIPRAAAYLARRGLTR
ncbi:MAG TPA: sugar phosphate isomerase/epimerase family protein [Chloroflexota bacterium]|nr:sugar phosphate isomerase/epimerase family protein [Chloroflexota bacterium]